MFQNALDRGRWRDQTEDQERVSVVQSRHQRSVCDESRTKFRNRKRRGDLHPCSSCLPFNIFWNYEMIYKLQIRCLKYIHLDMNGHVFSLNLTLCWITRLRLKNLSLSLSQRSKSFILCPVSQFQRKVYLSFTKRLYQYRVYDVLYMVFHNKLNFKFKLTQRT